MRRPSRRLTVLLCLSMLGIHLAVGLVALQAGGPLAVLGYAAAVLLLSGLGVRRAARLFVSPTRVESGRTCTCCTTSQHDPVKVI